MTGTAIANGKSRQAEGCIKYGVGSGAARQRDEKNMESRAKGRGMTGSWSLHMQQLSCLFSFSFCTLNFTSSGFSVFFSLNHSGALSLRQRELLGWFPTNQSQVQGGASRPGARGMPCHWTLGTEITLRSRAPANQRYQLQPVSLDESLYNSLSYNQLTTEY